MAAWLVPTKNTIEKLRPSCPYNPLESLKYNYIVNLRSVSFLLRRLEWCSVEERVVTMKYNSKFVRNTNTTSWF